MARPAAGSLLQAMLGTSVAEDQLTEMLAHVLANDEDFSAAIAPHLNVPAGRSAPEVVTQLLITGGRVDLEARFSGTPEHVVWIEVKDRAPEGGKAQTQEGGNQLSVYARELDKLSPRSSSQLVALAPQRHEIFRSEVIRREVAIPLTWQKVAETCANVGASRGGRAWRHAALETRCEARQRSIFEFLEYLEKRRVAMNTEPLSGLDVLIPARAQELLSVGGTIDQVLDAALKVIDRFEENPTRWGSKGDAYRGRGIRAIEPEHSSPLAALNGAHLALSFVPSDEYYRLDGPRHQPAFLAGVFVDKLDESTRSALCDQRDQLLPDQFVFGLQKGRDAGVCMIRYLGEVTSTGTTLTEQGKALGEWAQESLVRVLSVPTATTPAEDLPPR